ncbi:MAG: hypothetical protein SVG88_02200 [Halobacteriales archaeon]|nr:hypothetical protein [Halobacteriales archaeon]
MEYETTAKSLRVIGIVLLFFGTLGLFITPEYYTIQQWVTRPAG